MRAGSIINFAAGFDDTVAEVYASYKITKAERHDVGQDGLILRENARASRADLPPILPYLLPYFLPLVIADGGELSNEN